MKNILLFSSIPLKKNVLEQVGFNLNLTSICITEDNDMPLVNETPKFFVKRISVKRSLIIKNCNFLFIATKTALALGKKILFIPTNINEIKSFMSIISGKRIDIYTSICVRYGEKITMKIVRTKLKVKLFNTKELIFITNLNKQRSKIHYIDIIGPYLNSVIYFNGSVSNALGMPIYELSKILSSLVFNRFCS